MWNKYCFLITLLFFFFFFHQWNSFQPWEQILHAALFHHSLQIHSAPIQLSNSGWRPVYDLCPLQYTTCLAKGKGDPCFYPLTLFNEARWFSITCKFFLEYEKHTVDCLFYSGQDCFEGLERCAESYHWGKKLPAFGCCLHLKKAFVS